MILVSFPHEPRRPCEVEPVGLPAAAVDDGLAIALVDPGGRIRSWSVEAQTVTGHTSSEVIGRDMSVLADRPVRHGGELMAMLLRSGGGVRTDWVRCVDGTCRSIRWRVVPVPLATGTGLLAVVNRGAEEIRHGDPAAADLLPPGTP
ncbi:PAS domain S-box protein [Streptomyces scabiei]|uniref:PAS domain S-box protein n=1 Tax=Streptomyces scabiei TaxID=1930 RepID=UPI00099F234A